MIRLKFVKEEEWIDLGHGVRVKVLPPVSAIAAEVWQELAASGALDDDPKVNPGVEEAKAWARRVIVEWEGVGDKDGEPLDPAPESIDALIDLPWAYLAFRALYVSRIHAVEKEKKD